MAAPTKTASTLLIAHQKVVFTAPTTTTQTIVGGWIVVSGMWEIALNLYHAIVEVGANTNPATFYIHVSAGSTDAAASADFATAQAIRTSGATAAVSSLNGGGEPIGETAMQIDATSTIVVPGDWCYVQDTTTETDSEWHMVRTTDPGVPDYIYLVDGLKVAKDDADKIWKAEAWTLPMNVASYQRLRVVYSHQGAVGMDCAIKGTYGALTA